MLRKRFVVPVIGAAVLGTTIFGASLVGAQESTDQSNSLVQKIAQRFNLNQADVQKVFEEERLERHTQMKAQLESRLSQAVTDGKITESQKQAILAKVQQMHTEKQAHLKNFKSMSEEQRRSAMEQKRTELESWAAQQGLNLSTVHELIGPKGGMKMKGFGGRGMVAPANSHSSTASPVTQ